jgi:hypothetical protein
MRTISLVPAQGNRDATAQLAERVRALSMAELDAAVGAGGPISGGLGSGGGSGGGTNRQG